MTIIYRFLLVKELNANVNETIRCNSFAEQSLRCVLLHCLWLYMHDNTLKNLTFPNVLFSCRPQYLSSFVQCIVSLPLTTMFIY